MVQTGKDAVAEMCSLWRPGRSIDDMEEEAANALLIAAAPELLENLQFLLDAARTEPGMSIYKAHMDRACAAIAKAKGE